MHQHADPGFSHGTWDVNVVTHLHTNKCIQTALNTITRSIMNEDHKKCWRYKKTHIPNQPYKKVD